MIFFQRAPLIHHAGHISFWVHRLVGLAVAPHMPCSPAWSVVLGVMARWSAEAGGHDVHHFAGRRWGRRDLSRSADGGVGAEQALESA